MVAGELTRLRKLFQSLRVHFLFAISGAKQNISQPIGRILIYDPPCLGYSLIVLTRVVVNLRADGIEKRRDRIKGQGARVFLMRLLEPIAHDAIVGIPLMRGGVILAESEGALKLAFSHVEVPIIAEGDVG